MTRNTHRTAEAEFLADRLRHRDKPKRERAPIMIPVGEADELELTDAEREALLTQTRPAEL